MRVTTLRGTGNRVRIAAVYGWVGAGGGRQRLGVVLGQNKRKGGNADELS